MNAFVPRADAAQEQEEGCRAAEAPRPGQLEMRLRDELDECFGCGDLERVQKALRRASNAPAADQTELFMPIKMLQVRATCAATCCSVPPRR